MKEKFENTANQDADKKNGRERFENLIDELAISPIEITSFYAQKISKMPCLEIRNFKNIVKYAKFRMERKEWAKAYYYLNFIFFDVFRDLKNEEKNKHRNKIIDSMDECLKNLRTKEEQVWF